MQLMLISNNASRRLTRIVRDKDGQPTAKTYTFAPGLPVDVLDHDIDSTPTLQKDIRNKVLVPVEPDPQTNAPVPLHVDLDEKPKAKPKQPKQEAKPKPSTPPAP